MCRALLRTERSAQTKFAQILAEVTKSRLDTRTACTPCLYSCTRVQTTGSAFRLATGAQAPAEPVAGDALPVSLTEEKAKLPDVPSGMSKIKLVRRSLVN